jgi:hypothetical protein
MHELTKFKIIFLHFSVVVLVHNKRDEKRFWTEWLPGIFILIEKFINISKSIFLVEYEKIITL